MRLQATPPRRLRLPAGPWPAALLLLCACAAAPEGIHALGGEPPRAHYCVDPWPAPEGVDPLHERGAYLHPIRTPTGRVVTGDYPPSHRHQHGVSFPWTRTRIEGRQVDFWNTGAGEGTLRVASFQRRGSGFSARQEFVDLTGPEPTVVLSDTWEVRLPNHPRATLLDITSTQRATGAPLEVLQYHYGGFAARGSVAWEGLEERCEVLTSAGHDRAAADGARVRWCAMAGPLEDGEHATLAVLSHPSNPRAPQPVRVHPGVPYFCFAPCRLGPFTIGAERPWVSRYLVVACDGPPDPALLDELWAAFAEGD